MNKLERQMPRKKAAYQITIVRPFSIFGFKANGYTWTILPSFCIETYKKDLHLLEERICSPLEQSGSKFSRSKFLQWIGRQAFPCQSISFNLSTPIFCVVLFHLWILACALLKIGVSAQNLKQNDKHGRSGWDGSWRAVSSRSTLFAKVFVLVRRTYLICTTVTHDIHTETSQYTDAIRKKVLGLM